MFITNIAFNVTALCTNSVLQFVVPHQMKQESKRIPKLKAASHSEMQNVGSSTYVDGFTVNSTTQNICNSQNKNKNFF
jgi:hypothetical protein